MTRKTTAATQKPLFGSPLSVLNVGLASFADAIGRAGGQAAQVDWKPAAGGDRAVTDALARLVNEPSIEAANKQACEAYLAAQPMLAGVGVGLFGTLEEASRMSRAEATFSPSMSAAERERHLTRWRTAVRRATLSA